MQSRGITVIPTVCWGTPQSYWFCFDGLETGSIVAVSILGVRTEKELFIHGYQEMIKRVNPEVIIGYGNPFDEMEGNIIAVDYAKTNNLSKWTDYICGEKEIPFNSNLIVKRYGQSFRTMETQKRGRQTLSRKTRRNQNNYQRQWGHLYYSY